MIVCCGEALIDMIPSKSNDDELAYIPKIGGAIFNTSIALGRLGTNTVFLGSISNDIFGNMILDELKKSNVDTSLSMSTLCHTTLAFTTIKDGSATYDFFDENSSNKDISLENISLKSEVKSLFIGGISLMSEPNGSEIEKFINKESSNKVVFFDPNIRPDFIKDRNMYMKRFKNILSQTDIIKVSDEDLEWLYPHESFDEIFNNWIALGVGIVILTKGSDGAIVKTKNYTISSTVEKVAVVDTIGAGDTFNAGFLSVLIKDSNFSKKNLINIEKESLEKSLRFANKVAGINVGRAGANPPYLDEVE